MTSSSHRRRPILVAAGLALVTGCVGDEFDTRDDVPHPLDGDDEAGELDEAKLERILTFAEDSSATLESAAEVFSNWEETPEDVAVDDIDALRPEATAHIDTYDSIVAPNREAIAELEPGVAMNGEEWPADGAALADALDDHEPLLFHIEEASIGIVDASGDPNATSGRARDSVEAVMANAGEVVQSTRSALSG